jgi:hypothetical protein
LLGIIDNLLDMGADIDAKDREVSIHRPTAHAPTILPPHPSSHRPPTAQTTQGKTALYNAIATTKLAVVERLLEKGANVEATAKVGLPMSPVH